MKTPYDINWLTEKIESGDTLNYIFFWGHTNNDNEEVGKFCFSQWFECPFSVENITYKTAEHWMMARKAMLFGDKSNFDKIINSDEPREAKELGRQVVGYQEKIWDENKFNIVKLGNIHKFNQHPKFANYLLDTQSRILVEASPNDTIWGIGLSQDSKDLDNIYAWRGKNLLGFALMATRDFIKSFGHFESLGNSIEPPWREFPDFDSRSMFWRMGKGEDYLKEFSKYYNRLTHKDKTIYKLTNPEPYSWTNFYD